jgi:rod shape-determining protein MreC
MYRRELRRRRAVLLLLVVVSIVLLSTHFSEGSDGPLHGAEGGIASVLTPVGEVLDRALKPVRDMIDWVDETFDARGENDELRDDLAEAMERLAASEGALADNEQLRKLLGFNESALLIDYEPIVARVVGRSPSVWYSAVTLDRGSSAGISEDDPVVDGQGLVGTVTDVTRNTAQVRLITDHRSAVSARILPDGPDGIIKAAVGDPGTLVLDFIENEARVKRDDILVTAGWTEGSLSSRFPFGLRIGRVTDPGPPAAETFAQVDVEPLADLRNLDIVEVLSRGGS